MIYDKDTLSGTFNYCNTAAALNLQRKHHLSHNDNLLIGSIALDGKR